MKKQLQLILTTVDCQDKAEQLAELLIKSGQAGCVTVSPEQTAFYRWRGKLEKNQEYQLTIKTAETNLPQVKQLMLEQHPYDCPELLVIPVTDSSDQYSSWLLDSLTDSAQSRQP